MWLPVLEIILGIAAIGLATLVLRASRAAANKRLALLLAVDGVGWFGLASASLWIDTIATPVLLVVVRVTLAASPWLYLAFVAHALEHAPMVRGLRARPVQITLFVMAILVPLFLLLFGDASFYQPIRRRVGLISGPHLAFATFALVAAVQELQYAVHRRRAAVYLSSFAVRDVALVGLFSVALIEKQVPGMDAVGITLVGVKALLLVHIALLTYGLLSGQVLGMDDKVRRGLQKTVVAAFVAAIFITMTEGVEALLDVDSPALGVAAAGAVTFLFRPIHALGTRISEKLVPGNTLTGDYRQRVAVYQQQLGVAWRDGHVTAKEQEMLDQLAANLGIMEADKQAAEASARRARSG